MIKTKSTINRVTLAILAIAAAYFFVRGPLRATYEFGDFKTPYAASRAWLRGFNPYDTTVLSRLWLDDGNDPRVIPGSWDCPSVYPPTTFLFMVPFALLPFKFAKLLWLILNISGIVFSIAVIARTLPDELKKYMPLLCAAILCFAPLQMGLAFGNLTVSAFLLVVAALLLQFGNKHKTAGVILAIAVCLKPHLTLGPLCYLLLTRHYRILGMTLGVVLLVAALSSAKLHSTWPQWGVDLHNNILDSTKTGHINDPSPNNERSDSIISTSVIAFRFFGGVFADRLMVAGAIIFLAIPVAICCMFSAKDQSQLLLVSSVIAISLLLGYHRYCDGVFLLFAAGWSVSALIDNQRPIAIATLATLCVFLLPGDRMFAFIKTHLHLSATVTAGRLWGVLTTSPTTVTGICAMLLTVASLRATFWKKQVEY